MLSESHQLLKDRGYLRGEEQVDHGRLAEACAALLIANPINEADPAEIQDKGMTVSELRSELIGQPDAEEAEAELDGILARLTSAEGKVQDALQNGHGLLLLSAPVVRKIVVGERESTIKRQARFTTANHDLIETYLFKTQEDRTMKSAQALARRQELAVRRQPAIAPRCQPSIQRLHTYVALQLPIGT